MAGFGRVDEKGWRPSGGEGGGNLAADMARLTDPGNDEEAFRPHQDIDRLRHAFADCFAQGAERCRLGFNHLAGEAASAVSPLASGTKHPVCLIPEGFTATHDLSVIFPGFELQEWSTAEAALQESEVHRLFWRESGKMPTNLLVLDTPDIDSDARVNWERADHIRRCADVLIAVLTQQKYNDAAVKEFFRKAASEDKDVARLHSGDPSLYSAIAEQGALLKELGIDYEVVPGVPAFAAASAALGLELTLPEVNQTVILTRTSKRASAMPETESLKVLGASKALLAIHLSAKNTDHIVKELTPNYGEDCTVYITCDVTWPTEKLVKTTLKNLSETVKEHSIERTAIIFVGEALDQELVRKSALYDKDHNRHLKPAKD